MVDGSGVGASVGATVGSVVPVVGTAFGAAAVLLMQTGRAMLALLFRQDLSLCLMFYTTDVLSVLFAAIIMWIARRLDGILEEQTHYVKRIGRETASENDSIKAGRIEEP